jgi:hypothetical protein
MIPPDSVTQRAISEGASSVRQLHGHPLPRNDESLRRGSPQRGPAAEGTRRLPVASRKVHDDRPASPLPESIDLAQLTALLVPWMVFLMLPALQRFLAPWLRDT